MNTLKVFQGLIIQKQAKFETFLVTKPTKIEARFVDESYKHCHNLT